jgi:hypothetical protein
MTAVTLATVAGSVIVNPSPGTQPWDRPGARS